MATKIIAKLNGKPPQINVLKSTDSKIETDDHRKKNGKTNPWKQLAISVSEQIQTRSLGSSITGFGKGNGGPFPSTSGAKISQKTSLTIPGSISPKGDQKANDVKARGNDIAKTHANGSQDSRRPSLESASRKSVDLRLQNANTVIVPIEDKPKSVTTNNDSWIQSAIPHMPISLAILCLILNILIPGSGTVVSGVSMLCCSKPKIPTKENNASIIMCVNVWVGVAQMFTLTFLFVGWFWSLAWGIKMVILSVEHRKEVKIKRERELQTMALSAFGSPLHRQGRSFFSVS